jgi:hypothetical protein
VKSCDVVLLICVLPLFPLLSSILIEFQSIDRFEIGSESYLSSFPEELMHSEFLLLLTRFHRQYLLKLFIFRTTRCLGFFILEIEFLTTLV